MFTAAESVCVHKLRDKECTVQLHCKIWLSELILSVIGSSLLIEVVAAADVVRIKEPTMEQTFALITMAKNYGAFKLLYCWDCRVYLIVIIFLLFSVDVLITIENMNIPSFGIFAMYITVCFCDHHHFIQEGLWFGL